MASNKIIIFLTRSALVKKLQTIFLLSVVDISTLDDDIHCVALSGMKFKEGVELEPYPLFTTVCTKYIPLILDLMKVLTKEEFKNVMALILGQK